MNAAQLQQKQQEWANEIKNLMAEIQMGKAQVRRQQERVTFLQGAIAATNEQLQEMQKEEAERNEKLHEPAKEGNGSHPVP